ncbi:ankyrin repeat domain-containing protein, partial [Spiroplasma endosymbiont of Lariophagus distinguendus]
NNSDINAQDEEGLTILHYAVDNGDLEMVKFLIDYNFNLNDDILLVDELFKVLIKRFKNGANVNIKNIYGDTPLHYAVDNGYFEIAEFLLKNGANINAQDNEGFTPLYSAIDNNDFKIVELLIKNYVNVQIQFNNGNTALNYAKENNNLQIINLLYKKYKLPTLNNNKRKSVKN